MQAVILAAGRGKRLGAITRLTQKCLVRVAGITTMERVMRELPDEIDEIILVVGHHAEKVRTHFGDKWRSVPIKYVEQRELLGSADALHCAKPFLREKFLVLNGDDFYKKDDLERLIKHDCAIMVYDFGRIVKTGKPITDKDGDLQAIIPDSESQIVNTGAYVLDEHFFESPLTKKSPQDREYGLPHTIAAMAKDRRVRTVEASFWLPGGTSRALAKARVHFENK